MPPLVLDHLVLTTASLPEGVAALQQALGVELQAGGQHPRMGTHNALLKLGEQMYLEVIAADPQAPAPLRPRRFALDQAPQNSALQLCTWVARSEDCAAAVRESALPHGPLEPMSRGDLHWQITIPEDGLPPLQGLCPALIEWRGEHPATRMQDVGCELRCLELYTAQPQVLDRFLAQMNFSGPLLVHRLGAGEQSFLRAQIDAPAGLRLLGGR